MRAFTRRTQGIFALSASSAAYGNPEVQTEILDFPSRPTFLSHSRSIEESRLGTAIRFATLAFSHPPNQAFVLNILVKQP